MSTTKDQLSALIADKTNQDKVVVKKTIEAFMDVVNEEMKKRHSVQLRGFGTFHVVRRKATFGRNISKGIILSIPERDEAVFKFSKKYV